MNNAKLHHGVIRFFLSLSFYFIIFSQNAGLLKSTIENYKTFVYELYGFTAIGLNKIMSKKKGKYSRIRCTVSYQIDVFEILTEKM